MNADGPVVSTASQALPTGATKSGVAAVSPDGAARRTSLQPESQPTCRRHRPGVIGSGLLRPSLVPLEPLLVAPGPARVWRIELREKNMAAPKARPKHTKLKPKPKTEQKSWQLRNAARKERQTAHAAKLAG